MGFDLRKFPKRLLSARERRRWSQADLAKAVGMHPTHISQFECYRRQPSVENLVRLASALGCGSDYLLGA